MEAKLFLIFFFVLIVATLREFGINGCAEAVPDEPPSLIRFNVEDRNGRAIHQGLCGGALVFAEPVGGAITTKKCWRDILESVNQLKSNGQDPVVYAIMNGNAKYTVVKFVDMIPTPHTDPQMDEITKHIVLLDFDVAIGTNGPNTGNNPIPFRYGANLDDVQGKELLVGTTHNAGPLRGTAVDLAGGIANSWDKPYFQLTGGSWHSLASIGTPLYVKKNDRIRYLLGLRISQHQAINLRKLMLYLNEIVALPWETLEG